MITLAFTQMLYYLGISLAEFGGDDGMRLKRGASSPASSTRATPWRSITWRWLSCFSSLFATGSSIRGSAWCCARRSRTRRARGRSASRPIRYRLAAFVIAGATCGLAGALYANQTNYITPGLMSWQQSGDLMFMVILGGMASTAGPVLGAFALLLVEERAVKRLDRALAGDPRPAARAVVISSSAASPACSAKPDA